MPTVAIIGAGPAGAVAAIALKQKGYNVTLYDKIDPVAVLQSKGKNDDQTIEFGETGGGLSLYSNGLRALQNVGLLDAVETLRTGEAPKTFHFMKIDGSDPIIRKNAVTAPNEIPPLTVIRSEFHSVLIKEVHKAGIKTVIRKKLKSVTENEDGVVIEFEDGTNTVADLVVAADGIHSKTRTAVFSEAPKPVCMAVGHIGVIERGTSPDGTLVDFDYPMQCYMAPVKGRVVVCAKNGAKMATFYALDCYPPSNLDEDPDWRPYTDLPKEAASLAKTLEEWGVPQRAVTTIKNAKRITPVNVYDLPNLTTLVKGRVILIGDAAHGTTPTYGQGVNQAIEDAASLGDILGHFNNPAEFKKGLEVYNKIRLPRAHLCSGLARSMASRFTAKSELIDWLNRLVMKLIFGLTTSNDAMLSYDYREDLKKEVPGIRF
ncbi:FAD/NAD(P)-binding domain-containing protein [Rhizoclosmatium globosum]|uniref:FAD/NAD(P)-binding domain-containing protein n=1 Tax=Rhizoclosmatium globosum TaxID=329046 RepID=A0A1Y2C1L5_9FUNG|nr:FAD/NAD(P)-binding domain-containing protein [Rhizoclosmatium globosum]|eukprot:ORY40909.1 FAD/NAD(P)-binding domain-containing protein [Rhizoclosmatium globosum]